LTGRRGFAGDTTADTISAVLKQDPDWQALPGETPAAVRRLLQRCLQRDPKRRLHDIADARIELEDVGVESMGASPATRRAALSWPVMAAWTAVVATAAVLATLAVTSRSTSTTATESSSFDTTVTQLTNHGGSETSGGISPDGRSFTFVSAHGGTPDIWLRQVSGGDAIRLTNDAAEVCSRRRVDLLHVARWHRARSLARTRAGRSGTEGVGERTSGGTFTRWPSCRLLSQRTRWRERPHRKRSRRRRIACAREGPATRKRVAAGMVAGW
jgi:hypothetical protein